MRKIVPTANNMVKGSKLFCLFLIVALASTEALSLSTILWQSFQDYIWTLIKVLKVDNLQAKEISLWDLLLGLPKTKTDVCGIISQ